MSETLERNLKNFVSHNKEGSFSTHANRSARLEKTFSQLCETYTDLSDVRNLKPRHIDYLVGRWKGENLSPGTIKNRMSDLRWIAKKIGKQNIVHRTNDEYNIDRRKYVNNELNRAKSLTPENLKAINDDNVKYSLQLQEKFGLRREESIKFNAKFADKGNYIQLKDTWCKGGRPREVPIRTEEQRQLLNEVKQFQQENRLKALIPKDKNYYKQLKRYENTTNRIGEKNNHGLRHQYAQDRYKELVGWECPKRGGLSAKEMTPEQREIDYKARMIISSELGHGREEVTRNYLGR